MCMLELNTVRSVLLPGSHRLIYRFRANLQRGVFNSASWESLMDEHPHGVNSIITPFCCLSLSLSSTPAAPFPNAKGFCAQIKPMLWQI